MSRAANARRRAGNVCRHTKKTGVGVEKLGAQQGEHAPRARNHSWRCVEPAHVRTKAAPLARDDPARRCVGTPRTSEAPRVPRQRCANCLEQSPVTIEDVCARGKVRQSGKDETPSNGFCGQVSVDSTECLAGSAHAHVASHHRGVNWSGARTRSRPTINERASRCVQSGALLRHSPSAQMHGGRLESGDGRRPHCDSELPHRPGCHRGDDWRSADVDGHSRQRAGGNDLDDAAAELVLHR